MGRKEEEEGEIKSRMSREHVSNSCSLQQQAHRAERGWQGREAGKDLVFREVPASSAHALACGTECK